MVGDGTVTRRLNPFPRVALVLNEKDVALTSSHRTSQGPLIAASNGKRFEVNLPKNAFLTPIERTIAIEQDYNPFQVFQFPQRALCLWGRTHGEHGFQLTQKRTPDADARALLVLHFYVPPALLSFLASVCFIGDNGVALLHVKAVRPLTRVSSSTD